MTLGQDMELRYGTVPYGLASESQQWRMRAAMGYALAVVGGLGMVVLDRFDVLLKFDEVKDTDYADVEHFMAQTYFDLKNYDEAKAHVEKAYALGYPVFGLRDKLKRIGKY